MGKSFRISLFYLALLAAGGHSTLVADEFVDSSSSITNLITKECEAALVIQSQKKLQSDKQSIFDNRPPLKCKYEEALLFYRRCDQLKRLIENKTDSFLESRYWGIACEQSQTNAIHYEFECKDGFFSKAETFQVYGNWKNEDGVPLFNISPWYYIPIEKSESKERTLVIHKTKLSAALVTKTREFSNSKGYYWDEEKYYCQRTHHQH